MAAGKIRYVVEKKFMSLQTDKIKCPNCGHQFDVEEALAGRIQAHFQEEFEQKMAEQQRRYSEKEELLKSEQEKFKALKENENELFAERLKEKLKEEAQKIQANTREDFEQKLKALQEENLQKKEENRKLKALEINLHKREKELRDQQEDLQLTMEKELLNRQQQIEEGARKKERERFELKEMEWRKKLEDQVKIAEEMQRKAEQGSMQLQGEVQELAIEGWLREQFPLDTIQEVKKGALGADCLQVVNTRHAQNCGKIYYESKRTKAFQSAWIEKFKNDIRNNGADIGVLVTEAMPKDMDRMGLIDGVWVCSFQEFKGLCSVLREHIVLLHTATASQENRGDKMEMLYNFLTSTEFRLQIEGIVEGFTQMQQDLEREKRSMQGHWKKREKQIRKVIDNTVSMHGSIKGIAGNAIQPVKALELPSGDEDEDDLGFSE